MQNVPLNIEGTLIRAEEGPNCYMPPLQLIWFSQFSHLQWRLTPWVDTIGATMAIFQFPPLAPSKGQLWIKI